MTAFTDLGLRPHLLRAVQALGFTEPSPIQAASIPPALAGSDVLASAPTGSGKTAALGIPLLTALMDKPRGLNRALILAPTRELVVQIAAHLRELAQFTNLKVATVYGGVGFGAQVTALRRSDVIVATPGRLLDHVGQNTVRLDAISFLVLDEADRMFDMGFLPVVRKIVALVPKERQTLMFSATMPPKVADLAGDMLIKPVRVDLSPKRGPAVGISQTIYTIEQHRKPDLLVELLKGSEIFSAIAFTRTKARADKLAGFLQKNGIAAERIHGNRSQAQRQRALDDFKRGKFRILVATDVASRGIDIADLGHVINFDVPNVPEDYVHRVGRTARAQAIGDAITMVSREEEGLFTQIERALGKRLDRAKVPDLPERAQEEKSGLNRPYTTVQTHQPRRSGPPNRRKASGGHAGGGHARRPSGTPV